MGGAACKEEACRSKSLVLARPGSVLRGVVSTFGKPETRKAFADADVMLQQSIIEFFETHAERQLTLENECIEIGTELLARLRADLI